MSIKMNNNNNIKHTKIHSEIYFQQETEKFTRWPFTKPVVFFQSENLLWQGKC